MTPLLVPEQPCHNVAVEALNDRVFGPQRHFKTVAQLRQGVDPEAALCYVAVNPQDGALMGSIRYWPIVLGGERQRALMLGPVVAHPDLKGQKIPALGDRTVAAALIDTSMAAALSCRFNAVVLKAASPCLVPYYETFGFSQACVTGLQLPGPDTVAESVLLMGHELTPGSLRGVTGVIASAAPGARLRRVNASPALTKALQFA